MEERPGDFAVSPRMVPIAAIAVVIGAIAGGVAWVLLRLIGFFTNVFYYHRFATSLASPADNGLGAAALAVPIAGALIVGVMARFGSEKIRGHGIPEAIEAILTNGSRVEPKVAVLKPMSAAISIGSGGPFGAEGPIIMTGGAIGSIVAQFIHLSGSERKTLLAAGAAAGMSATFAAPVASVLLAIELLLFEWRPRSVIPVALASAVAAVTRRYILGNGPLFPTPPHAALDPRGLAACVLVGLLAGLLSLALTYAVYGAEDAFARLPIHWMWWPAIGGLVIGIGGFIFPPGLGVGYGNIGALLAGNASMRLIVGILIIKSVIWSVSLGSGTSGGVLAPLLMTGGALGALVATFLPGYGPGFWPMVAMGAVLGGTMRAPLTGVVFSLELTHDLNAMLPLLVAVMVSYGFTVLVMKRSILTEKVSRRGYHLRCEYEVDPLEVTVVREVMRTDVAVLGATMPLRSLADGPLPGGQRIFPVVDGAGALVGVATRDDLRGARERAALGDGHEALGEVARREPVVAYPDEPLRAVAYRMAETGYTRMPVVKRDGTGALVGLVSLTDLLAARARALHEEHRRERVLRLSSLLSRRTAAREPAS